MNTCEVAIIGSGPAGLSAAARAAELGLPHILLESAPQLANTLFKYQKGKRVMAEPRALPLRSPMPFSEGIREDILAAWNRISDETGVQVRLNAEVVDISGQLGAFSLHLKGGESVAARHVVLAIGLQGNQRKIGVDGDHLPFVQYQLDDPEEYEDEVIVVLGAGDSAIENALALMEQNKVIIVNRRDEFARAKEGNLKSILKAIQEGKVESYFNTSVVRVTPSPDAQGGIIVLNTSSGEVEVPCQRIIARLGAVPPRQFLERLGVAFASQEANAPPNLTSRYESTVPGLYIVGSLAGYPLIKQALNQGYEVIEFIQGRDVEPADEPLLRDKFRVFSDGHGDLSVAAILDLIGRTLPLLAGLAPLQLREFMLDSHLIRVPQGQVIFRRNDYTDTFYSILEGEVGVEGLDPGRQIRLGRGEFFGEMSLISGRRRSATVVASRDCVLIETPRRSMTRLLNSVAAVKRVIDEAFLLRAVQAHIAPHLDLDKLAGLVHGAQLHHYKGGQVLFREGDAGATLHLVRRGSLTVSRTIGGREIVLSYVHAGQYVGEMAMLGDQRRTATVRAAVDTETIGLEGSHMQALLAEEPELRRQMEKQFHDRLAQNVQMEARPDSGTIISYLVQQGVGEATDVLLIDESLCVRCDHCEKACAATHRGTSRLDREAGPTFASIHVPTSCRHCEHPHCMKDCPPDAIHRSANGEVFIGDNCIGCGNCQSNCPYGVIQMAVPGATQPAGLLSWLLFGVGREPGAEVAHEHAGNAAKVAVKCDMCKDLRGGPACVRACPTGAAIRVNPREFMTVANLAHY